MPTSTNDDREFTDEELQHALKCVGEKALQAAFAAGRPVPIAKNGRLVLLYEDGTEEDAGPLTDEPTKSSG